MRASSVVRGGGGGGGKREVACSIDPLKSSLFLPRSLLLKFYHSVKCFVKIPYNKFFAIFLVRSN